MNKLICIECPVGCELSVDVADGKMVSVAGNQCPRGVAYARVEIESPLRYFTGTVAARGLEFAMLPVRTSTPIPRSRIMEAAAAARAMSVAKPVACGEILVKGFLGLTVDLIATRDCPPKTL
jgi:CxxC motif-containing protein